MRAAVTNRRETDALGVIEIDIPSRTDLVTVVRMIVVSAASAVEALTGDRLDDLRWVTSEAITNAVEANLAQAESDEGPQGRVRTRCEIGTDWVRLTVIDEGPGMSEAPETPDIEAPDRLELEGGFGVPLMQHLASREVKFVSGASGTTVELELHQ